jgi:hypothetical protein
MSGVIFQFAEDSEHFISHNHQGYRVYIAKSTKNYPDKYFWSRSSKGSIYFGRLKDVFGSVCFGSFVSDLTDEEKHEFVTILLPEIEKLGLISL